MLKFEKYYGIISSFVVDLPSQVRLFETPWTVAHQVPLSMGFPRQEYWSGLPFSSPGDLPNPGVERDSPALASTSQLALSHQESPIISLLMLKIKALLFLLLGIVAGNTKYTVPTHEMDLLPAAY